METQSKPQTDLALAAVDQSINALFNRAPVMMHWVRKGGTIAKVNRRWLARMGYKRHEVLGRKSIDFLTEHSRFWAVEECLPLFFRVGSARGVGFEFVKKNGQVLDSLLDAETITLPAGESASCATIRKPHRQEESDRSSTTIRAIEQLIQVRSSLHTVAYAHRATAEIDASSGLVSEMLPPLVELGQNISYSLRGLVRTSEEWLGETAQQQRELLLLAKNIDLTLRDMADTLAEMRSAPKE